MSLISDMMEADIATAVTEMGGTFVFNGTSVACAISPIQYGVVDNPDCTTMMNDLQVCYKRSLLTTHPALNSTVVITDALLGLSGVEYLVRTITEDQGGITMTLWRSRANATPKNQ